jgi:hypothetical protein
MIDRYNEIERENQRLLDRMTVVLTQPGMSPVSKLRGSVQPPPMSSLSSGEYGQGTVRTSYQGQTFSPAASQLPRLNNALDKTRDRRRNAEKIEYENQIKLKRLQDMKPTYNVQKWLQSDEQRVKLFKHMCEYDYCLRDKIETGQSQNRYRDHRFLIQDSEFLDTEIAPKTVPHSRNAKKPLNRSNLRQQSKSNKRQSNLRPPNTQRKSSGGRPRVPEDEYMDEACEEQARVETPQLNIIY